VVAVIAVFDGDSNWLDDATIATAFWWGSPSGLVAMRRQI
jgi:hypothetical protein